MSDPYASARLAAELLHRLGGKLEASPDPIERKAAPHVRRAADTLYAEAKAVKTGGRDEGASK